MMKMPQGQQQQAPDLSDADVNTIKNTVGGEDSYNSLMEWVSNTMPKDATTAFDNLVNTGDAGMIQLAVMGLQSAYQQANGMEGEMYTGRSAREMADVYRSQDEAVQCYE